MHVHPGAEELGRVYQADARRSMPAWRSSPRWRARSAPVAMRAWDDETEAAHGDVSGHGQTPPQVEGPVQMGEIVRWLEQRLPDDAILTNGAGNYATWVHRFHRYRGFRTQLAPTYGSMGYGVPAAVAAKLVAPERMVVVFRRRRLLHDERPGARDRRAVQRAGRSSCVVNNGIYGTIRMHQERDYPGRVSGTDLINPDFAALARAYGAHGEMVEQTADFAPAFERARKRGQAGADRDPPRAPEVITPRRPCRQIRAAALWRPRSALDHRRPPFRPNYGCRLTCAAAMQKACSRRSCARAITGAAPSS